ncbi:MAG: hypothetical protein US49_C0002G0085 [candidate division TM6 bacterium GW2011_GWF2_37_49]|nr:MAG: hypothetical protein US49_C0002G0085 [candidate division TM6 bacterium GW2011_GWF2_37_49]
MMHNIEFFVELNMMKNLKKILTLVAFLFTSSVCAMQPDIQASEVSSTEALQASSPEIQEFENLLQATLNAKKPPILKQISFDTIREIIRLGTVFFTLKKGQNNDLLLCTAINFLIPLVSDLTIRTTNALDSLSISANDPTFTALKKLRKYITTQKLSVENKNKIREQFNKCFDQLCTKFQSESSEKHPNQYLSVNLYRFIIRLFVCFIIYANKNINKDNESMLTLPYLLSLVNALISSYDLWMCADNLYSDPTGKKVFDLAKGLKFIDLYSIKEALKDQPLIMENKNEKL